MALRKFGFIVTGKALDPQRNRMQMRSEHFEMIAIGVTQPEEGVAVAKALVEEGVQLLELCGGFGPLWTAKIIEAIGGRIPVGSVAYGPESIDQMHALFAP
jgi:2-keto-3-deoxy-6-phosphogluconate aldolase